MSETTPGREPVVIVELQQPFCANTFGVAPCTATGTNSQKCYNTRSTCKDTANYTLGTPLSLYFTKSAMLPTLQAGQRVVASQGAGHVWDDTDTWDDSEWWQDGEGDPFNASLEYDPVDTSIPKYLIPSLMSVSTAPTRVNLASSSPDAQGLGNRAVCSITFQDHQHTDRVVDPYVDGRSWDALAKERGTFWGRWIARNKYRQNIVIKIYEGYAGQALSAMKVRTYFLQSITPPDASGRVTIQGKDILARIEERKAQVPPASPGVLYTAITDSATSFEVANAVEADYPATGTLRIGDEVMTYTGRATSTHGITFTGVTRGTDNSTADEHSVDAGAQECRRYEDATIPDVLEELLGTDGGVPSAYLDTADWDAEFSQYLSFYNVTALITEPVSVSELVSELQEQALFYVWWDERDALVKLKAIRGVDAEPPTLTDRDHIIDGSFSITEKPRERASQVWIYYDQDDFTKDAKSPSAYNSQFVIANLESETDELYGEASIRKIYARWLDSDALAQNTASKIITRYVDVPSECKFRLDAKDRGYWVGDTIKISHSRDRDEFGDRRIRQWAIVSAEEVVPGEVVEYVAEDTTLYGRIYYIMDGAAADYPGYDAAPFKNCYIGDASGLLSDGESAGRIS